MAESSEPVWYVAYGSNLHAARLACYLGGGRPPGGLRTYPGCRDPRPPRRSVPVFLPGGVYFAGESRAWTGGMAFYDPELPGEVAARAYLLTAGQFADVAAQEMYRPPGTDLALLAAAVERGTVTLGPGRYETLVCAGLRDGYPLVTFTAPGRAGDVPWNPPAATYLGLLAAGLAEAHGWAVDRIVDYLAGRPGVAGRWDPDALRATVADATARVGGGPSAPGR
ncbi:histone deacetylase [Micromonospora cathayae]|uniref:Histone deacetylase n=1 Tax=Micromonospora cathayae TaxID=3028804 RepID=A0ABY7ZTP7_9ACTN|nr:histone deacetylase [Micromonospora sp. HUAS 3]WDZ85766.1 histone deacetylase [Micromonospora sp. HUAS 3]